MKMYQTSPMEKFNKSNPFIIIAKKSYDSIIDSLQAFGKDCIKATIVNFLMWAVLTTSQIYIITTDISYIYKGIVIIVVTLLINIFLIYAYRKRIGYFITMHTAMKEFDRLSNLEVNDILALNNEDILKCINNLYTLHGELTATIRYYHVFLPLYALVQVFTVITTIV